MSARSTTAGVGEKRKVALRPYREGRTLCPVTMITPPEEPYIHTFFDVSPWSPSGRFLVCLRLPFEDREPRPGDAADICLIDLEEETIETIYRTRGWAMQVAAHQQWGPTDRHLYFGDMEDGRPFTVEYDLEKRTTRRLDGPLYYLSPDGRTILSPSLTLINFVIKGYGVSVDRAAMELPPRGPVGSEGLWQTDVETGRCSLLLSFRQMAERLPQLGDVAEKVFLYFHTKVNRRGDRIMQVGRNLTFDEATKEKEWDRFIVTFRPDLSEMRLALPPERWALGGHHPDWHPDGDHITMNLKTNGRDMRFCRFLYDGSDFEEIRPDLPGGGHPSLSPGGRFLVTDGYVEEPLALKNDETPVRLCDTYGLYERALCTIRTVCDASLAAHTRSHADAGACAAGDPVEPKYVIDHVQRKQSALDIFRLDPHPAWNRDGTQVCFNGAPEGRRQLLVADVRPLIEEARDGA